MNDLLSAAPDADSESLALPGTWTALRDMAIDPPGELIPFLTDVGSPLDPAAVERPEAEVDDWPLMSKAFAAADAWRPCWALTWATRSLRSTLALTPLCSLCTQRVNCCEVGAVWRIDSNIAVTRRPAGVSARFAAAWWAVRPAPESSVRPSRHEVDPAIDGTN